MTIMTTEELCQSIKAEMAKKVAAVKNRQKRNPQFPR
jgi:hypothetical protein